MSTRYPQAGRRRRVDGRASDLGSAERRRRDEGGGAAGDEGDVARSRRDQPVSSSVSRDGGRDPQRDLRRVAGRRRQPSWRPTRRGWRGRRRARRGPPLRIVPRAMAGRCPRPLARVRIDPRSQTTNPPLRSRSPVQRIRDDAGRTPATTGPARSTPSSGRRTPRGAAQLASSSCTCRVSLPTARASSSSLSR